MGFELIDGMFATGGMVWSSGEAPPPSSTGNLVMTFNTALANTNPGNVYLPLGVFYGDINANIDWGDGSNIEEAIGGGVYSHTYAANGTYQVTVTGTVSTYGNTFANGENEPLVSVDSWDNDLGLTDLYAAFWYATNLNEVPNTLPANVQFLNSAFWGANTFNQDLNGWNTSNVGGWDQVFFDASAFNGNIASWDTSLASSMTSMFQGASSFNQDIGGWNVSNVTIMNQMFQNATSFNQNLSSWVSNLASQPTDFSLGANAIFANNASNLKPYLSGGTVRINT
jgi:surface protein